MDSNSYPDLVVGSPLSNAIIVLRTRPVYRIKAFITNKTAQSIQTIQDFQSACLIKPSDQDSSCVNIEICFEIDESSQIPSDKSRLNYSLEADILMPYSRVYFTLSNSKVLNDSLRLDQKITCMSIEMAIKNDVNDLISPIEFRLTYDFARDLNLRLRNNLNDINNRPMIHQENSQFKFTVTFFQFFFSLKIKLINLLSNYKANFKKECGSDNVCNTDLKVSARFLNLTNG